MTAVRDLVSATADSLARQQARVDVRLSRALAEDRWSARLPGEARAALQRLGHFPGHSAELDWTPVEVAGHLRDSALVFTERIHRLRTEAGPLLPDFVPTDAARLAGYRAVPPAHLVEHLRAVQAALFDSVSAVRGDELDRSGVHETDGPVTLADVLAFLPGHQHDHAEQLVALVGR